MKLNQSLTLDEARERLGSWYNSPFGQMLRQIEARYLARAITVSYKQKILQIGTLGWENLFLDEGRYSNFFSVIGRQTRHERPHQVRARSAALPFASESIDLVLMPHVLEFEPDRYLLLCEVERVLKPEGQLLLLGFNPWSIYRLYHLLSGSRKNPPWCGKFVSRQRLLQWLESMNFQADVTTGFYLKPSTSISDYFERRHAVLLVIAYAVKAIKRRYTMIPLKPAWQEKPGFIPVDALDTPTCTMNQWKKRSESIPMAPAGVILGRAGGELCSATTASKKNCTAASRIPPTTAWK